MPMRTLLLALLAAYATYGVAAPATPGGDTPLSAAKSARPA
ncbi:hypothetical protein EV683_10847 [Crenobacter luteus]|nr:hypothetical protein [Crenobacter luteus]TCP12601.1 hypothetical protein EV683_10847 [Crenobacter luteus]